MATTESDGYEQAAARKPDVALVDLGLPDTGVGLWRRLRTATSDTKMIILTGDTDSALFPQPMAACACGYLIKDAGLAKGDGCDPPRRERPGRRPGHRRNAPHGGSW